MTNRKSNFSGCASTANASAKAQKVNVPFCLALVLLCLTMVSMHLTGGLFARYSATAESSDSARVAKFEVGNELKQGGQTLTKNLVVEASPGESVEYAAVITNSSEVTVRCTVGATNITGNIPFAFVTDQSVVTLAPGESTRPLDAPADDLRKKSPTLNISWNSSGGTGDPQDYMGMVDVVEISLKVEQVD